MKITEQWLLSIGFRPKADGVLLLSWTSDFPTTVHWSIEMHQGRLCDWWYTNVVRATQDIYRMPWPEIKTQEQLWTLLEAMQSPKQPPW